MTRLCLSAGARRIEHHGIEGLEFGKREGFAEEIALIRPDRLQPFCVTGSGVERCKRSGIGIGPSWLAVAIKNTFDRSNGKSR